MPITDAELTELTAYIADLEAQVDFLMRERILYREGAAALTSTVPATGHTGPVGNAGQPVLTHDGLYAVLRAQRSIS